ncbi:MAG: DUF445 family protein [Proteobacteria bacterium]|nr:DUF445 family protein [Pseudomonadota bacterium]
MAAPRAPLSPADQEQLTSLRRMQAGATALLGASLATLVAAKALEPRYPALAYLAAFAEAATIGGLADWYAVVALFRRPLGLPIPHTAILPSNQDRVAESLGSFIEANFLAEQQVRAKLAETDFAKLVVNWLADEKRAGVLAGFAVRMLPHALNSADASRLRAFVADRVMEAAERVNVAPLIANLIEGLVEGQRHQHFLDELLDVLSRLLLEPKSVETVLLKIREELPSLLRTLGADGFLLRKIITSAAGLIEEVKQDPDHSLRLEVDKLVRNLVLRLRNSPEFQEKVDTFKNTLLQRPETAEFFAIGWESLKNYVTADAESEHSALQRHLTTVLVSAARALGEDPELRAELNSGMVTALSTFIAEHKQGISTYISNQVKAWDMEHMTLLVETKIGRDLQYIRFNGTLIGGLIGLILYSVLHAFGLR